MTPAQALTLTAEFAAAFAAWVLFVALMLVAILRATEPRRSVAVEGDQEIHLQHGERQ